MNGRTGRRPGLEPDETLVPSLLDRLLDDRPDLSDDPQYEARHDLGDLRRVVARDLEALLNTRREALEDVPPEFGEACRSLLVYGLPDLSSLSLASADDRTRIEAAIAAAITTFEPRLERVRVALLPPREGPQQGLHFRVEGRLRIKPAPLPIHFDAELEPMTQQYVVKGQD